MIINLTGHLESHLMLLYRVSAEAVAGLVPAGLELRRRGPWAYVQVEEANVSGLHVAGLSEVDAVGQRHRWLRFALHAQAMTDRIHVRQGLYVVRTWCDGGFVDRFGATFASWRLRPNADWHPLLPHGRAAVRPGDSTFTSAGLAHAWMTQAWRTMALDGRASVQSIDRVADDAVWQPVANHDAPRVWPTGLRADMVTFEAAAALVCPTPVRWRVGHVDRLLQPGTRGVIDTLSVRRRPAPLPRTAPPPAPVGLSLLAATPAA